MSTELLSPKLLRRSYAILPGGAGAMRVLHEHWCPGCEQMHQVAVDTPFRNGARWTWNGDPLRPTFSPSVKHTWAFSKVAGKPDQVCHYFIRDGRIEYCPDSHHALSGQTIDLPDIPADEVD